MNMKSSELPNEVKRNILDSVQKQIGFIEYSKLVNSIGEDGVINIVLKQSSKEPSNFSSEKYRSAKTRLKSSLYPLFISLILAFIVAAFYPDGKIIGSFFDGIVNCILPIFIIGAFILMLICWIGSGFQSSDDLIGGAYSWCAIISGILATAGAFFYNVYLDGVDVIYVFLISFFCCIVIGYLFVVPYVKWIHQIENGLGKFIAWALGIILALFVLVIGTKMLFNCFK